jgi:acyl carrier protein/ribosomal protein S18 acetylase RimI-like enzyme
VEELSEVLAVLSGVVSSPEVAACDPLDTLADLGVDSLTLVEFVAALERRFAVKFSERELESLGTATVRDICQLVARAGSKDAAGVARDTAPVESRASLTVRGYREADRAALRTICVEQSGLGTFKSLAPIFFLEQYYEADPSSCFVAELEGRVVGYWVGTLDVDTLRREFLAHLARRFGEILGWYRGAWRHLSFAEHRRFWRHILVERYPSRRRVAFILREVGEIFGKTYVHFQVDRTHAPAGTVFSLARAWIEHLRRHGVQGALVPTLPGGESAIGMWRRLGFVPVKVTRADGMSGTWLVAIL